jgi:glutamate/tyrosine decarboxylase-like PLP-dependent enzyme
VPEAPGDPDAIIAELVRLAGPGLAAMTGPRFFGWVIGGSDLTGVAADWLTSAWGQNAANIHAAPAVAACEQVACSWLLELLDLPRDAGVGLATGATMANFIGLAAARGALLGRAGWDADADGLFGAPPIDIIVGEDAHTTVFAALKYLGLGWRRVQRVATDSQGAMLASAFERTLAGCSGPVIAIAQAGQINTGAFDPVGDIAPMVRARGGWLHVDGAFGLWARACPERAHLAAGLELADSWATDGHKWLQTPYDCGYAIVRDADAQRRAMTIAASYLPPPNPGERDPSHYVPELSRRARGFATWAMLKRLGRQGVAELVGRHCAVARQIGARLAAADGVTVLNDIVLNQVIVRFGDSDALTLATIDRLVAGGEALAGPAAWRGQQVMRLSLSSCATRATDADRAVDAILAAWDTVRRKSG